MEYCRNKMSNIEDILHYNYNSFKIRQEDILQTLYGQGALNGAI